MADSYSTDDRRVAATFVALELTKVAVSPYAIERMDEQVQRWATTYATMYKAIVDAQNAE